MSSQIPPRVSSRTFTTVILNSFQDLFPKFTIPLIIRRCPSAQIKSQTKKNPHTRSLKKSPIFHPSLQIGLSVPIQKIARSHRARPIFLISPTIPHPTVPSQKKTAENKCIHIHSQRFSHIYHIKIKHNYSYNFQFSYHSKSNYNMRTQKMI